MALLIDRFVDASIGGEKIDGVIGVTILAVVGADGNVGLDPCGKLADGAPCLGA